jgi:hypothetical protein
MAWPGCLWQVTAPWCLDHESNTSKGSSRPAFRDHVMALWTIKCLKCLQISNSKWQRSPSQKNPILQLWKEVVNTMLFILLKTHLTQYIGSELSNNALFVYTLSNSDFCDPIPWRGNGKKNLKWPHRPLKINTQPRCYQCRTTMPSCELNVAEHLCVQFRPWLLCDLL